MDTTQPFADWLAQAWDDHADDPHGVALRLAAEGPARATGDADLPALALLVHHLHGEHLASLEAGQREIASIAGHALAGPATRAACVRFSASLELTAGEPSADDPRTGLSASDRARVNALAAGNLATRQPERAGALLREAFGLLSDAGVPADDPAVRTLAATSNNLASTLETLPTRTPAQRHLMTAAAALAREAWGRAGTWLEIERADYRLAMSWLAAGDATRAREHAAACLATVQAHGNLPLEAFFAWEATGRSAAAAGDAPAIARAVVAAQEAYARLDPADQTWVQPSLDGLAAVRAIALP